MSEIKSKSSLSLGFNYFIGIFILAFILGTIRTLWITPILGNIIAVLMELPIILISSWIFSKFLINKYRASHDGRFLIKMGATAFLLLMITEFSFSIFIFGRTMNQFFSELITIHGLIGISGQIFFGFIPILQKYFK